LEKNVG